MSALTVFFDIGGTLVDCPDIFEIITRRLVRKWPDIRTSELVLETYQGMINVMRYKEDQHPFQNIVHLHAAEGMELYRRLLYFWMGLGGIGVVAGISFLFQTIWMGIVLGLFWGVFLAIGVRWYRRMKDNNWRKYIIILASASGDSQALASLDEDLVD